MGKLNFAATASWREKAYPSIALLSAGGTLYEALTSSALTKF
jgi:hypothetical protein